MTERDAQLGREKGKGPAQQYRTGPSCLGQLPEHCR